MDKSFILSASLLAMAIATPSAAQDQFAAQRAAMVATIRAMATAVAPEAPIGDDALAAIGRVERHRFVPEDIRSRAYENRPLPIGKGQTISQPYIVALMTELTDAGKGARVLEVGTGSGYQAAVLAEAGAEVYSIEIIPELGQQAAKVLAEAGYGAVKTRIGDGYAGWPDAAPFDAIIVTAAPDHVPQSLVDQLKPGGRLVIPVGGDVYGQQLQVLTKSADGKVTTRTVIDVRFVPLTRSP